MPPASYPIVSCPCAILAWRSPRPNVRAACCHCIELATRQQLTPLAPPLAGAGTGGHGCHRGAGGGAAAAHAVPHAGRPAAQHHQCDKLQPSGGAGWPAPVECVCPHRTLREQAPYATWFRQRVTRSPPAVCSAVREPRNGPPIYNCTPLAINTTWLPMRPRPPCRYRASTSGWGRSSSRGRCRCPALATLPVSQQLVPRLQAALLPHHLPRLKASFMHARNQARVPHCAAMRCAGIFCTPPFPLAAPLPTPAVIRPAVPPFEEGLFIQVRPSFD